MSKSLIDSAKLSLLAHGLAFALKRAKGQDLMIKVEKILDKKFNMKQSDRLQDALVSLFKDFISEIYQDDSDKLMKFVEDWHEELIL